MRFRWFRSHTRSGAGEVAAAQVERRETALPTPPPAAAAPAEELPAFEPTCLNCSTPMGPMIDEADLGLMVFVARCDACGEDHHGTWTPGRLEWGRVSVPAGSEGPAKVVLRPTTRVRKSEAKVPGRTGTGEVMKIADAADKLHAEDKCAYYSTIGKLFRGVPSGHITEAAERCDPVRRIGLLLSALHFGCIADKDLYYPWYLLAQAFDNVGMEEQAKASTVIGLTHTASLDACAWWELLPRYFPDTPWKDLPMEERQVRLRRFLPQIACVMPSTEDGIRDLLRHLVIPTGAVWKYPKEISMLGFNGARVIAAVADEGGGVISADLASGAPLWEALLGKQVLEIGPASGGKVMVLTNEGLYGLAADSGRVAWKAAADISIDRHDNYNLLAVGERLALRWGRRVLILREQDGATALELELARPVTYDDYMWAVGDHLLITTSQVQSSHDLPVFDELICIDLAHMLASWSAPIHGKVGFARLLVPSDSKEDGIIVVLTTHQVLGVQLNSGKSVWAHPCPQEGPGLTLGNGLAYGEVCFVTLGKLPEMRCLSARNGNTVWSEDTFGFEGRVIAVQDWTPRLVRNGVLYANVTSQEGYSSGYPYYRLALRADDGSQLWCLKGQFHTFTFFGNNMVLIYPGEADAIDCQTGESAWRCSWQPNFQRGLRAYHVEGPLLWVEDQHTYYPKLHGLTCIDMRRGVVVAQKSLFGGIVSWVDGDFLMKSDRDLLRVRALP